MKDFFIERIWDDKYNCYVFKDKYNKTWMPTKGIADFYDLNVRVINQTIKRHKSIPEFHDKVIFLKRNYIFYYQKLHFVDLLTSNGIKYIIFIRYDSLHLVESKYRKRKQLLCEEEQFYLTFKFLFPSIYTKNQFKVLNYYIDLYLPNRKMFIEYDEEGHSYRKEYDIISEKEILNIHPDHTFFRIKKGDELNCLYQLKTILDNK